MYNDINKSYEYFAFISYKREDEKWAKWLQKKLETYNIPIKVRKENPNLPAKIRPVFRDQSDLSGGNLNEEIEKALSESKYLIVICSPRAAQSPWVSKEVQYFIDHGKEKFIIPFIIGGIPNSNDPGQECFPMGLRELTGEKEILGININEIGREAAVIKVISRMFSIRFDTLWQRYQRSRKKNLILVFITLLIVTFIGIGISIHFIYLNKTIEKEKENTLSALTKQTLSLADVYLSEGRPEMALLINENIKKNITIKDSLDKEKYHKFQISLIDSLLFSPIRLIDVYAVEKNTKSKNFDNHSKNYSTIAKLDSLSSLNLSSILDIDLEESKEDLDNLNFELSNNLTFLAFYEDGDFDNIEGSHEYSFNDNNFKSGMSGIKIYNLSTKKLIHFIPTWAWYSWMTTPYSLSNSGDKIIFHEGWRNHEKTWYLDFKNKKKVSMYSSISNNYDVHLAEFCNNEEYFFLFFPEKKLVDIFDTQNVKKIYTFRYENIDNIYWDINDNLIITSEGSNYVWKIKENILTRQYSMDSYAEGVSLSPNNNYTAAACNDGKVYLWNNQDGSLIISEELTEAPEDIVFSQDNKKLWAISGYIEIIEYDIQNKKKNTILSNEEWFAPHPWNAFLYMTNDGNYCIAKSDYGNSYYILDMKGNLIDYGNLNEKNLKFNHQLAEFDMPEKFDYDPDFANSSEIVVTAKRESGDGKLCVEATSDGKVIVYPPQKKESLEKLITNRN